MKSQLEVDTNGGWEAIDSVRIEGKDLAAQFELKSRGNFLGAWMKACQMLQILNKFPLLVVRDFGNNILVSYMNFSRRYCLARSSSMSFHDGCICACEWHLMCDKNAGRCRICLTPLMEG